MNPEDDPEARIRQLEQPLTQYAVELGTTQPTEGVNPTAQLPPPVYDTPPAYNAPPFGVSYPQVQKKGAPIGLIFGLIAVVVVVLFGAVGAIVWKVSSNVGSISTTDHGETSFARPGGGSFDEPSTAAPVVPSAAPEESPTVAPAGGQYSISGVDEIETVECNGSNISVSGVNNTVTLLGHCLSVTVSGIENQVTLDSADLIGASGFDNQVIYHSGTPQINATGSNSVAQG